MSQEEPGDYSPKDLKSLTEDTKMQHSTGSQGEDSNEFRFKSLSLKCPSWSSQGD